jgi:hypothetical protein
LKIRSRSRELILQSSTEGGSCETIINMHIKFYKNFC